MIPHPKDNASTTCTQRSVPSNRPLQWHILRIFQPEFAPQLHAPHSTRAEAVRRDLPHIPGVRLRPFGDRKLIFAGSAQVVWIILLDKGRICARERLIQSGFIVLLRGDARPVAGIGAV